MGAALAAWVRVVAEEQQKRRNALFDAMGGQLRSAQRRRGFEERSAARPLLLRAVAAWHGEVRLRCKQETCSRAVSWACGRRTMDLESFALVRTLLAWHSCAQRVRLVKLFSGIDGKIPPGTAGGCCDGTAPSDVPRGRADSPPPQSASRCASTPRWSDIVVQEVESPLPLSPQRLFPDAASCPGPGRAPPPGVERRSTGQPAARAAPRERPRAGSSARLPPGGARTPGPGGAGPGPAGPASAPRAPPAGGGCGRPASAGCGGARAPGAGGGCGGGRAAPGGCAPLPGAGPGAGGERPKFAFAQPFR